MIHSLQSRFRLVTFPFGPARKQLLLLVTFILVSELHAASAARISEFPVSTHRFPRNLRRLYDGTWDSIGAPPFSSIPTSEDPSNHSTRLSQPSSISRFGSPLARAANKYSDVSFTKSSGFTVLNVDNHPLSVDPSLHIVFGELILRDGSYRTSRDVSMRLIGVYDLKSGTLVVVGDVFFDDVSSALQRLYDAFVKARPVDTHHSFNLTEEQFIAALTSRFVKYRKQTHPQRRSSVAENCPFSASFKITPRKYEDSAPSDTEFSGTSSFDPNDSSNEGRVPLGGASMLAGRADGAEDGVNMQDEMVEMKGYFVSEACNTKMNVVLTTLDTETLFGKAINYTLLVTVVAFIQVVVLIRQMEMTSTQAGARRVSLTTVGLQAVADSYLCLGHLTMGIAVQTLFNAFATAAFFKFICFSIFLMRWMLLIWKARRPSGFSEGWEAMRRELSMLYSRFYGSLIIGLFLLYELQDYVRLFVFGLYSFWVPQILLNAVEDHRRPLLPMYILGTSITRLAIPLYFWGCPNNFLHIEPQPMAALGLVGWLMAQSLMLLSQYKFGPRWFIPKEFLPEKYNYFRAVSVEDDDIVDLEASEGGAAGENRPLVDKEHKEVRRECCICMESVAIHSRERMVTPCNHFFHAVCLERWLEVRLECALCRSSVPPP